MVSDAPPATKTRLHCAYYSCHLRMGPNLGANALNFWACLDSNQGPRDYESPALTAVLQARREAGNLNRSASPCLGAGSGVQPHRNPGVAQLQTIGRLHEPCGRTAAQRTQVIGKDRSIG